MKRFLLISISLMVFSANSFSQSLHPQVEVTAQDEYSLTWTGVNHTYFLQYSSDLKDWSFFPEIESGAGNYEYNFSTNAQEMFLRLKYFDGVVSNPRSHDHDGDGLSNWEEIRIGGTGTDPFKEDTNGDGTRDDGLVYAAVLDPDGNGLSPALQNGLIGRWDFENLIYLTPTTPHFHDHSGNGRHAKSTSGLPPETTQAVISKSCTMPGFGYLNVPPTILTGVKHFSVSMWIRPTEDSLIGTSNAKVLWSAANQANIPLLVLALQNERDVRLWRYTNGALEYVGEWLNLEKFDDGNWRHLTLSRGPQGGNNTEYRLFINGQEVGSPWSGGGSTFPNMISGHFYFGIERSNNFVSAYNGFMDRALFHNRALVQSEAEALYKSDIDGDGLWDITEQTSLLWRDLNSNGFRDAGESHYLSSPYHFDSPGNDGDRDGLSDLDEQNIYKTNVADPDTDKDLLPDGWEVANGLDPLKANSDDLGPEDSLEDNDSDGATNLEEYSFQTDPNNPDSDGDGVNDGSEIDNGSDPNYQGPNGEIDIPAEEKLSIQLAVGDQSGSESEDYIMRVFRLNPDTGAEEPFHILRSGGHGQYKEETVSIFRKNESYSFQIDWLSSSNNVLINSPANIEGPDYDYTFKVNPQGTTSQLLLDSYDPSIEEVDTDNPIRGVEINDVDDFPNTVEKKRVLLLAMEIVPDWNRDGKIDSEDRGQVSESTPFHWWINDDNDRIGTERGSNLHDIPDPLEFADWTNNQIDGMRDLIDFFPLHLDLRSVLEILPRDEYKYVLKHESSALKYYEYPACVIDGSDVAHFPNRHVKTVGVGRALASKQLEIVSAQGSELSANMLRQAKDGKGVIVLEGAKKTNNPLVLEIIKKSDNNSISEIELPLKLSDVEDMYRHVNMRDIMGGSGGHVTQTSQPSGYPDNLTNGKYVGYVHGFNVSGESARGSQSNIFKRLHHLGNKSRFIGISWFGNPDNPGINLALPPDYHRAVYNGLTTGMSAQNRLAFTQGSGLTILAHSLGNSMVGNAIANHGLQVDNYFIINGAIPLEAYDSFQTNNSSGDPDMKRNMTEDDWKPFYDHGNGEQQRLFASNWHELFAVTPADHRNKLTWKNIFAKPELLGVAYNFYSPSDEVVENPDETEEFGHWNNIWDAATAGRHAWVQNEMAKGGQNLITPTGFHDINGGWVFNNAWDIFEPTGNAGFHRTRTPAEALNITNDQLKTEPFHKHLLYPALYDPAQGSATAGVATNRYKLLGTGIPATSYAIAVNSSPKLSQVNGGDKRNFDMPQELRSPGGFSSWPAHENANDPEDWMHSDFKDVAFHFLHPMYQKMIDLAELDEN